MFKKRAVASVVIQAAVGKKRRGVPAAAATATAAAAANECAKSAASASPAAKPASRNGDYLAAHDRVASLSLAERILPSSYNPSHGITGHSHTHHQGGSVDHGRSIQATMTVRPVATALAGSAKARRRGCVAISSSTSSSSDSHDNNNNNINSSRRSENADVATYASGATPSHKESRSSSSSSQAQDRHTARASLPSSASHIMHGGTPSPTPMSNRHRDASDCPAATPRISRSTGSGSETNKKSCNTANSSSSSHKMCAKSTAVGEVTPGCPPAPTPSRFPPLRTPLLRHTDAGAEQEDEAFARIMANIRAMAEPLADLDETMQDEHAPAHTDRLHLPVHLTYRTFHASLVCPKKFYLLQHRSDLLPRSSIGELVHFDDTVGFSELARRWDRLQFGSKAIVVHEKDFAQAVQRTEDIVTHYFHTTYASLGEQAPSLTIHRPALMAPFGGDRRSPTAAHPLQLRARPCVLRYRPKDNQWMILHAHPVVDPMGTTAKAAYHLQRFHFAVLVFRYWITQPHIPIAVRKRFLQIDLDGINAENAEGRVLESSARVLATPIDLKRSGILHIRQFFPGPATLLDCDPQRLVKFVQRLSLEEMLEMDAGQHQQSGGEGGAASYSHASNHSSNAFSRGSSCGSGGAVSGAFDIHGLHRIQPKSAAAAVQTAVSVMRQHAARVHSSRTRSARSTRAKDLTAMEMFASQQRLMELLLTHVTLPLVERTQLPGEVHRAHWTCFSRDTEANTDANTQLEAHRNNSSTNTNDNDNNSTKCTPVDAATTDFSTYLGTHCSRGELCPFFQEGCCLPAHVPNPLATQNNHLFTIPSLSVARKVSWWSQGMRTVRDVLHGYKAGTIKLTAPQLRYAKAVTEGCVAVNPREVDAFFARVRYPAFVIDFEAVQFALPPFSRQVAYQSIPFQFSLDVFQTDILTETPTHYDFLHFGKNYSPNADPRRACIEELMRIVQLEREKKRAAMEVSGELAEAEKAAEEAANAAVNETGSSRGRRKGGEGGGRGGRRGGREAAAAPAKPTKAAARANQPLEGPATPYDGCFIAHYAAFEKSCLEKLGQLEEQYKEEIKRFFFLDTMDLFRKGFIHPNTHGSNSLKKVLPALCPDIQYGVFGSEEDGDDMSESGSGDGMSSSLSAGGVGQDEQKGENAMGVYRLWAHQESGNNIQELHRSQAALHAAGQSSVPMASHVNSALAIHANLAPEMRDRAWAMLRIQLLEYCSLDTKGLYEIMREMHRECEAARNEPPSDRTGWVFSPPVPRETML